MWDSVKGGREVKYLFSALAGLFVGVLVREAAVHHSWVTWLVVFLGLTLTLAVMVLFRGTKKKEEPRIISVNTFAHEPGVWRYEKEMFGPAAYDGKGRYVAIDLVIEQWAESKRTPGFSHITELPDDLDAIR
jgi:hypothetical protein